MGRFQPLHLGHMDAIRQSLKNRDMLIIAIGSGEQNFRPENPLTAGERIEMVKAALDEEKIPPGKYLIIPIANISNFALWPAYVDFFLPVYETLCTGSDVVKCLYKSYNAIRKKPYKIFNIRKNLPITSTQIRKLMLKGKKWEHLVPKSTASLLKKWDIVNRLKSVQEVEK